MHVSHILGDTFVGVCTRYQVTAIISRYVVGVVFGFEHLLLVLAIVLQYAIQPVPKWVRNAIGRRNYLMHIKDTSSLGEDTSSLEAAEEMSGPHEKMKTS